MRAAIAGLLLIASTADARMPDRLTALVEAAPVTTLEKVLGYFAAKSETAVLARELPHAKVYALTNPDSHHLDGFVLLVEDRGTWHAGGHATTFDAPEQYEVSALERVTNAADIGYRFELSLFAPTLVGDRRGMQFAHVVMLCSGKKPACVPVTVACQKTLDGQAVEAFSGTLTVDAKAVTLTGKSTPGTTCTFPARYGAPYFAPAPPFVTPNELSK